MANYNLTYSDIINSFSQTVESDFAVGAVAGATIINNEIAFQYEKLNSLLPQTVLNQADKVSYEIANVNTLNTFTPTCYAISGTMRAWKIYKGYSPCSPEEFIGCVSCGNQYLSETSMYGISQVNVTLVNNNLYLLQDSSFNRNTQDLVISYDVNSTLNEYGMLKTILRDMVCASLGSRLFPSGADVWSIVQYYKEESEKYLQLINGGKWNPLGINLLFKPNAYRSIKIKRA